MDDAERKTRRNARRREARLQSRGADQKPAEDDDDDDDETELVAEVGADRKTEAASSEEPRIRPVSSLGMAPRRAASGAARAARPIAGPARLRPRHWGVIFSFLLMVIVPAAIAATYLWTRAVDQYASTVGFSVRKEETSSAVDILGGLSQLSAASSSDTDVLYSFIQSQELVRRIDDALDLHEIYSRHYDEDPVFSFRPGGTIEDLIDYWGRMVTIYYDPGTGLVEIRVLAFDPDEAQTIATKIFEESSAIINRLSAIARDDATRYAREELDKSIERLKQAREATTAFRNRTQIVDPAADVQGRVGLLNTLQAQLAEALIELDLLRDTTRNDDPRIVQAERRIEVINARIAAEREKFGAGAGGGAEDAGDYASLVAEFERLGVDLQFAEEAYKSSLSAYDGALAEAQRQSRYLAAHVLPTRAESSRYPERTFILGIAALFLILAWSILVLIYYSIRDRR